MTHQTYDVDQLHENNAATIPVVVREGSASGNRIDLNGADAEYVLKESQEDDDEDAIVTLTGDEGGDEDEIEFTDPSDGELEIHIATGDTDGAVDWDSIDDVTTTLFHRLDVTDADGNLATVFTGEVEFVKK